MIGTSSEGSQSCFPEAERRKPRPATQRAIDRPRFRDAAQGEGDDRVGAFEELVGSVDPPMYVVTVASRGERSGCLVGFAGQTSIDPPRFAVWISAVNHTAGVASHASEFVVHVLRADDQRVAEVFGELTGDDVDKFALLPWTPTPSGTPVLAGCDHFVGRVVSRIDTDGDHCGYVLEPGAVDVKRADGGQFGLRRARQLDPGHPA
jgi:flavin reductase (DIM6/NTAB) family NADH-FMN oxidoreductase RutF